MVAFEVKKDINNYFILNIYNNKEKIIYINNIKKEEDLYKEIKYYKKILNLKINDYYGSINQNIGKDCLKIAIELIMC